MQRNDKTTLHARRASGNSVTNIVLNGTPDTCPICHVKQNPVPVLAFICAPRRSMSGLGMNGQDVRAEHLLQCTNAECGHAFIAEYAGGKMANGSSFELVGLWPKVPVPELFPESIALISSGFVKVYNQAYAAEQTPLSEIAGMGYRKALEFLIKDYLLEGISTQPEIEKIRKKTLGNCIKEDVQESRIKECAKRAVWLGNDETHYERRWVDKDIADLKTLIHLTVNWIDSEAMMKKYMAEMPSPQ